MVEIVEWGSQSRKFTNGSSGPKDSSRFQLFKEAALAVWRELGIGEALSGLPLPHHQAYGSVPWRFARVECVDD